MKKLLIPIFIGFLAYGANAQQGGSIRAGVQAPSDYTGRSLNWTINTIASTATTTDTVFLNPYGYDNVIQPSDSVLQKVIYVIQNKPVNYVGDRMKFVLALSKKKSKDTVQFRNKYNTSFKFLKAGDSTITIIGGKRYYGEFVWDGSYWIETVNDTIIR